MGQAHEKGIPVSDVRLLQDGFKNLAIYQYVQLKCCSVKTPLCVVAFLVGSGLLYAFPGNYLSLIYCFIPWNPKQHWLNIVNVPTAISQLSKAQLPTVDKLHLTNLRRWKFGSFFFFFPGRLLSSFPVEKAKLHDLWLKGFFVIKARNLQQNSSHHGGRECKKNGGRLTLTT